MDAAAGEDYTCNTCNTIIQARDVWWGLLIIIINCTYNKTLPFN